MSGQDVGPETWALASGRDDEGTDPRWTWWSWRILTRKLYTKTQLLFYGWRYLWGLPFRWRNKSQKHQLWAVRQFLKWLPHVRNLIWIRIWIQCTSSLTTKLGHRMGVHFDLRLWAAWTLSWQLFWQLEVQKIRIIQAESLTSSRLTFEGCNCWKQDDPRSSTSTQRSTVQGLQMMVFRDPGGVVDPWWIWRFFLTAVPS